MGYTSKLLSRLTPYVAGEQPAGRVIKLNTNENPYAPSPKVAEAIRAAAQDGELRRYPDPACAALRSVLASLHGCKAENIFCGNGSDEVLAFSFAAFLAEDRAATPEIGYSFYPSYAKLFNTELIPTSVSSDFEVDTAALARLDMPVILANPNAPTTLALPRDSILSIADAKAKQGRLAIIDEAYADFAPECSVTDEAPRRCNLLVVRTFSKSYSLAGLRVGYAVGRPALIAALETVRDSFNSYTLDTIAQAAATAAALDRDYFNDTVGRINAIRERFRSALSELGFIVPDSRTNFLFARHPSIAGAELFGKLRERGVIVRYFAKPRIADYVRITIGAGAEMDEVAAIIKEIVS
ncbi:MAG: aminotransferase class I/II-fold pyridoxal phosphate-dependent enzyme [Oscillospiraceae bacterium]|nr:aminotransferase class I/II-fold pyridoxal phosphate-dependent enzyme [Oscillospiraceae bacterium]